MDYQIWMERLHEANQLQLAPMIRTVQSEKLHYRINVQRVAGTNSAVTRQTGTVVTTAGNDTRMTQINLSYHKGEQCEIELNIEQEGTVLGQHHFKCTE